MYEYLVELGWEGRGRVGVENQYHEFVITSEWGMPFKWRVDLQYAANGTWVDVFYYPTTTFKREWRTSRGIKILRCNI
jgi:hypothetical protein